MRTTRKKARKPTGRRPNNEGSVTKRSDGRWQVAFTDGKKPDGTPKRAYRYAKTEDEANSLRKELAYLHDKGEFPIADSTTFGLLSRRWLDFRRMSVQPGTHRSYEQILRAHVHPSIGDMPIHKLNQGHIERMMAGLAERRLGPRSRALALWLVKSVFTYAIEHDCIAKNPASRVRPPKKAGVSVGTVWSAVEVSTFLRASSGDRMYAAFFLMILVGLRRGELLGLRWSSVDLHNGTAHIKESLRKRAGGGVEFAPPKTASSNRTIYLSADLITVLRDHRDRQDRERALAAELWVEHDLVFATAIGTTSHPDNLKRVLKRLCKLAAVRVIRVHDLRHTHASLALQRGTDDKVLSERLGHTSVAFTRSVYQHTYEEQRRRDAVPMDELLGSTRFSNSPGQLMSN